MGPRLSVTGLIGVRPAINVIHMERGRGGGGGGGVEKRESPAFWFLDSIRSLAYVFFFFSSVNPVKGRVCEM